MLIVGTSGPLSSCVACGRMDGSWFINKEMISRCLGILLGGHSSGKTTFGVRRAPST
jgi:hypothetical protein